MDANSGSPATRELVEGEARRILDGCARQALDVLTRERPRLEALVVALLEVETLDAGEIYRTSDLPVPGEQVTDVPALG